VVSHGLDWRALFINPDTPASHAIGYQLGPLGVGHGETSCLMLPAVCKWNAAQGANIARQQACVDILMNDAEVRRLMSGRNNADLGDILDSVIRELGMPRTAEKCRNRQG
jgi:alcohol dehydrogenase class IV